MDTHQELSIDELNTLFGGISAPAAQTKQTQVSEIKDYSFDVEQVLSAGS